MATTRPVQRASSHTSRSGVGLEADFSRNDLTYYIAYFDLNADTVGAMGAAYYAGAVIGMGSNWYLPNKYGRLRTIQLGCVMSLVAAAIQTSAQNFAALCAGRAIGGVASGVIFVVCPTYASEISPPKSRGRIGGLYS